MVHVRDEWTPKRIAGIERFLADYPDDPYASAFLQRLRQSPSLDQKRDLIVSDLLPALRTEQSIILWHGTQYPTRLWFVDLVTDYLCREGVLELIVTELTLRSATASCTVIKSPALD